MNERPAVTDWATDFDHLSDEYANRQTEILADLRENHPVAHTNRFHGAWMLTRYDDITAAAHQTESFSSRITAVNDNHPDTIRLELPPITLDPPLHGPIRRALLPPFNPREMAAFRPWVDAMCERLLDDLDGRDDVDGALDYAQLVPVEVMAYLFGVTPEFGPQFRAWVDAMLKEGQLDREIAAKANREVRAFFSEKLRERAEQPSDDLITMVLNAHVTEADGTERAFSEREKLGALFVMLLGGIDTTWSTLGASLFHLGTHPEDLARLVKEPELLPGAIEEFLRFYSPVTIARVMSQDGEAAGQVFPKGERVLLSYPAANRDPRHFEQPDEVVLDRRNNRHLAFGVGVHRCMGSNLARMELEVALHAWLRRFPRFELAVAPEEIQWTVGPVRGPRKVPLRVLERSN